MTAAFIGLKILGAICAGAIIPVLAMVGLLIFFSTDETPGGIGARRLFGFLGGVRNSGDATGQQEPPGHEQQGE